MEIPAEPPSSDSTRALRASVGSAPIFFAIAAVILAAIAAFQCWEKVAVGAMVTAVGAAAIWKGEESGRRWLSLVGGILSAVSVTGAGWIVIGCLFLGIGPIRDRDDWPSEVRRAMEIAGLDDASVEVGLSGLLGDRSCCRRGLLRNARLSGRGSRFGRETPDDDARQGRADSLLLVQGQLLRESHSRAQLRADSIVSARCEDCFSKKRRERNVPTQMLLTHHRESHRVRNEEPSRTTGIENPKKSRAAARAFATWRG